MVDREINHLERDIISTKETTMRLVAKGDEMNLKHRYCDSQRC